MWIICLLMFFVFANPATFRVTRQVVSGLASPEGLPTQLGVLVHAVVYVLTWRILQRTSSRYSYQYPPLY